MDIRNFALSYYKNSVDGFHIQKITQPQEAKKPHSHDYYQIYCVIGGSVTHHVGSHSSRLGRGDMFIVPPGAVHYISTDDNAVFYVLSFMEDFIGEPSESNRITRNFLTVLREEIDVRAKISVPTDEILEAERIMERVLAEFCAKPFGYTETVRAYTVLIITLFARRYMEDMADKATLAHESCEALVLRAVKYIDENFTERLTLADITARLSISRSTFCKLFGKITGKGFNEYLNLQRIRHSLGYIKNGYKLTAICGLCGYSDYSTFVRNFRRVMGICPADYAARPKETDDMQ